MPAAALRRAYLFPQLQQLIGNFFTKMFSVLFFLFPPILLVHSLDLDAALAQGKFERIFEDKDIHLNPSSNPSSSMYFDNLNDPNLDQTTDDTLNMVTLQFHGEWSDTDYKLGLSLLILSFDTDNGTTSLVVSTQSRRAAKIQEFRSDIELPDSTIQEENIIRTWELFHEEDPNSDGHMAITLFLNNLTFRSKVCVPHPFFYPRSLLIPPPFRFTLL